MFAQNERIRPVNIEEEMKVSYISYAMSVIVSRALPDVRDGLKPVHRRVIFSMHELGLGPSRPYRKSAKIVGETMGKYHPHGDSAIYDSLVRMAQDFSIRYPVVDGQGNFGSVDGDPPAAMRYTEARLSRVGEAMLTDIDKETVDFIPNFDESEMEPTVLPSVIPNLLVNGSAGIAVGMATNIPPHNLVEVVDAVLAQIDNPDITTRELMALLPGPDFPTGATICGRQGILDAYETGRGRVVQRATAVLEQSKAGKQNLIVTEIPYMVNKANLIREMADLIRDKRIEGIADLRDESDRDGMRIVIELKRGENYEVVLNQLYKHTKMQNTFGVILLALVDGRPVYLSLKEIIDQFIKHRREVITRRTRFLLAKAEARAHILEGLRIALDNIDAVVALIRKSADAEQAKTGLMNKFKLSDKQAQAILDMRLQRLTGLEREKLEEEYRALLKDIEYYKNVLSNAALLTEIMKTELREIKERFGDDRRTKIVEDETDLDIEDLIAEENMVVTVSHQGYIKRISTDTYRQQKRGGRGIIAVETKETDFVEQMFIASTHHYVLFFTNQGRVYWQKVYALPQGGRATRGKAIVNLLELQPDEKVTALIPVAEFDEKHFLVMVTRLGVIKKTDLAAFSNPRRAGIIAMNLDEEDQLIGVQMTDGTNDIIIGTRWGMAIRFSEDDLRSMGRNARGVKAINLAKEDDVVAMEIAREGASLLTVTRYGYGKRTLATEYRRIHRGGKGVIDIQTSKRNGEVVGLKEVFEDDEVMIITQQGIAIRQAVKEIREISRNTQGVRLIRLEEGDTVATVATLKDSLD